MIKSTYLTLLEVGMAWKKLKNLSGKLPYFPQLKSLDLSGISENEIPDDFCDLELEELYLPFCKLQSIPSSVYTLKTSRN